MKTITLKRFSLALTLICALLVVLLPANVRASSPTVFVLTAEGEVAPAMRDYLARERVEYTEVTIDLLVQIVAHEGGFEFHQLQERAEVLLDADAVEAAQAIVEVGRVVHLHPLAADHDEVRALVVDPALDPVLDLDLGGARHGRRARQGRQNGWSICRARQNRRASS